MPGQCSFLHLRYVLKIKTHRRKKIKQLSGGLETRYQTRKKDALLAQQRLEIRSRTITAWFALAWQSNNCG